MPARENVVPLSEQQYGRTKAQVIVYDILRVLARSISPVLMGFRALGRENFPTTGGALVCSNHQSHFDPIIVGLTCDRRLNYVARKTLFGFLPFRILIEFLDAIPIERDGIGIGGLKATLKRLKRGEMVLIFPEGTRSKTGEMGRLRPGFCTLARRGKVPIVPVGFDGGYDAWPRSRPLPGWSRICVCIGEPIEPGDFADLTDKEMQAEVERRIRICFERAKRMNAFRRLDRASV